jgi:hypothetical protein
MDFMYRDPAYNPYMNETSMIIYEDKQSMNGVENDAPFVIDFAA